MEYSPTGSQKAGQKRARSPTSCSTADQHEVTMEGEYSDTMRSKRHLSEAMASTMSRLLVSPSSRQEMYPADSAGGGACPMDACLADSLRSPTPAHSEQSMGSVRSQDTDASHKMSGHSPVSRSRTRMLRSPRQKGRHRLSPLKTGMPYPKSPRFYSPSGNPHLNRMAAAVEARESMPPSPSDTHGSTDLRKAALLRSVMHRRESTAHSQAFTPDGSIGKPPLAGQPPRLSDWSHEERQLALQAVQLPKGSTDGRFLCLNTEDAHLGSAFMDLGFASPDVKSRPNKLQYGREWLEAESGGTLDGRGFGGRRRDDHAARLACEKPPRKSLLQNSPMDY